MTKRVGLIVQIVLASILLLYACDWAALRVRVSHGTAFRTLQIDQYLATPLKGNKAEYDYMGAQPETCSRSLFPQSGSPPCWWLAKHTSHWE
jgi:hypothetical protein